ncbi:MAG: 5'-nucleotidase C-terminal domain-containing protein [Acidobacteria bacterium]|nr:5'-nucleotidase C-terminal domain-containing protein [Acidobacteriota bacterium]
MADFPSHRSRTVFVLASLLLVCVLAGPAGAQESVTLTVLATTDVHGHVWPHDYLAGRGAERGLAKVSSYVKSVRARQPHTLLLDCGDTFQGTPLAYLYAEKHTREANPVAAAMNRMGYDAMAVGNHEWNMGLATLWRLKEQARFPILGANVVSTYHDSLRDFEPYVIRRVGGVRVAILGMVTPAVPRWDPPEHRAGYEFRDLVETAKRLVPGLRRRADVVILIVHSGLGRREETGEPLANIYPEEDRVWDIAEQLPGLDVILFGHSHRELAEKLVNGVLLVQAKNWAQSVAEVELRLTREGQGWRLAEKTSRVVPMDASIAADEEILELTRAAHERTEEYLNTVVTRVETELDARTGRLEDHPLVELIHKAQRHYGRADVSLAALFSTGARLGPGPVTVRDIYRLYFYENKLFTVEITGAQLKEALEYAARVFKSYPWPAGESPFADVPGYNFDMADGVSYRIDLRRPVGERIVDLEFGGAPLKPEQRLRVALNSYRWSGGGGYEMLRHAKIVERVDRQVRELIIDYVREQKRIETAADGNWEIVPAEARQALVEWVTRPQPPVAVRSEAELERAVRARPDEWALHVELVEASAAAGRLPERAQWYKQWLGEQPDYAPADPARQAMLHAALGSVHWRAGNLREARSEYRQAVRLEASSRAYTEALSTLEAEAGWQGRDTLIVVLLLLAIVGYVGLRHPRWVRARRG